MAARGLACELTLTLGPLASLHRKQPLTSSCLPGLVLLPAVLIEFGLWLLPAPALHAARQHTPGLVADDRAAR